MRNASVIFRWGAAAGCSYFFVSSMGRALKIPGLGAAGYLIIGFAALIAAVLLVAPETVTRLCEFCSRLFTTLVFPDARFKKPKLSYILPCLYAKERRYPEAIQEYQKLLEHYPKEHDAHLELISVLQLSGQSKLSTKYIKRFTKLFPNEPVPRLRDHLFE